MRSIYVRLEEMRKLSTESKKVQKYTPKRVYLPLAVYRSTDVSPIVKVGDKVKIGDVVAYSEENFPIPATVSGEVIGFEERFDAFGDLVKCIVIENDFKDKWNKRKKENKNLLKLKKETLIAKIRDAGIVGMGGSGFPTYIKYNTDKKINTLIVNGAECEPYTTCDYALILEEAEKLVEATDLILSLFNIDKAVIAIQEDEEKLYNRLKEVVLKYPKIKVKKVFDGYPAGWEKNLVREICKKEYDKLPLEVGVIVNNVGTILALYDALKYDLPPIERYITITGDQIRKPQNILARIGSPVDEIIKDVCKYKKTKEIIFIANGPLSGKALPSDKLIVTKNLTGVVVLSNEKLDEPSLECIRCGRCVEACPAHISPILIKDAYERKDIEALKRLGYEKCVECGLCSFVCPSKVEVTKAVIESKKLKE